MSSLDLVYLDSKWHRHRLQVLIIWSQGAQSVMLPEEVKVIVDSSEQRPG